MKEILLTSFLATAEPPLPMTVSVPLAIRNAVAAARMEADNTQPKWYPFGTDIDIIIK